MITSAQVFAANGCESVSIAAKITLSVKPSENGQPNDQRKEHYRRLRAVAIKLAIRRKKYEEDRDMRAVFTYAYEILTLAVMYNLYRKDFMDREWLVTLDETFADYYFRALDAYSNPKNVAEKMDVVAVQQRFTPNDFEPYLEVLQTWPDVLSALVGEVESAPVTIAQHTLAKLNKVNVSPTLQETNGKLKTTVAGQNHNGSQPPTESKSIPVPILLNSPMGASILEALIYGIAAHIVGDLPYVLNHVKFREGDEAAHFHDFHLVNDILEDAIEEIQEKVGRRYSPLLAWLDDKLVGDEILTNYGLRVSRSMAWYNAVRLQDPDKAIRDRAEKSIRKSVQMVIYNRTGTSFKEKIEQTIEKEKNPHRNLKDEKNKNFKREKYKRLKYKKTPFYIWGNSLFYGGIRYLEYFNWLLKRHQSIIDTFLEGLSFLFQTIWSLIRPVVHCINHFLDWLNKRLW